MKKLMKKLSAIVLVATMLFAMFALTGCGKTQVYELTTLEMAGLEATPEDMGITMTLTLEGNGKAQLSGEVLDEESEDEDLLVKGTWEETEDGITVVLDDATGEITSEGVVEDDTLTFDNWLGEGFHAEFKLTE